MNPTELEQQRERISGATVTIEVLQGRDLIAKDRNLLGRRTTSDPYVQVFTPQFLRGKTKTCRKTLSPVWTNELFSWNLDMQQARDMLFPPALKQQQQQQQAAFGDLFLKIFDHDEKSSDDFMGGVSIPSIREASRGGLEKWFPVQTSIPNDPDHCRNAKGELQIRLKLQVHEWWSISRGQEYNLEQHPNITANLSWHHHHHHPSTTGSAASSSLDIDSSCVAVDREGNIALDESVYYGNLCNPNQSIAHSGDQKTRLASAGGGGFQHGTETISVRLGMIPQHVLALYFFLTVAGPLEKSLHEMGSAVVHFSDSDTGLGFCRFVPVATSSDHQPLGDQDTALCLLRLSRANDINNSWNLTPIAQGYSHARDFGALVPQLKNLTRDLVPGLVVDPNERMAILRKGGAIRLDDYHSQKPMEQVTLGLAWDVTDGINIDLDASALLLDANYQMIDQCWFRQLTSNDGSVHHSGDEREGDEVGDDEKITVYLSRVSPAIKYICFIVNSFSGQELDDVSSASCHLFDRLQKEQQKLHHPQHHTTTRGEMAKYTMTNCREMDKHTGLLMGILFRDTTGDDNNEDEDKNAWNFWIVSEPLQGRIAEQCVPHLQQYLRTHLLPTPERIPACNADEEPEIAIMPESVPVDEEIVVLSDEELDRMTKS